VVSVDTLRCAYCGSCVSVCPVGALDLRETRLVVSAECTECNLCLAACPMGALVPAAWLPPTSPGGRRSFDVVVVGAGPAGSVAAAEAARHGLSVLLLEKRQEIGSPVRCAEGITHAALAEFVVPETAWISAEITKASITIVSDGHEQTWEPPAEPDQGLKPGYVLERRVFDRRLAEKAAQAGAHVWVKTAALDLLRDGDRVAGVRCEGPSGRCEVTAKIVIGADGIESRVGWWAGLDTTLPASDLMSCAQFLLAGIDIDPQCTYYYLDPVLAPGGYIWIFPKGDACANVGLGVQSDISAEPPLQLLTRFVESHPFLARGSAVTLVTGGVPVALSPSRITADGCMLVGDAARQVDPLTGGGIANGMAAGRLAARVAAEALASGDVSQSALGHYDQEWATRTGRQLVRNYRLRARFPPEARCGERFMRLFALTIGAGI